MSRFRRARLALTAMSASMALIAAGCSVGAIGGGSDEGSATTTISFLTQNDSAATALGNALIKGFTAQHPDIKINMETQPGGTEGDNLTKTKLATGEMADVFTYNSGSLFHALNPETNLTPLSDRPWVKDLEPLFADQVTSSDDIYGAPLGTTSAGAVLYNRKIYDKLGLQVPTDWAGFVANNKKIAKAGEADPIEQSYGDTWTSQLFVLGDFGNVAAQDPQWAEEYTKHHRKYAEQPAVQGFLNQAQMHKMGFFNKDFASATYEDGVKAVATGQAAHYPMLSSAVDTMKQNTPENINDVGLFALPAQKASDTRLTVWMPGGVYIPKTTTGDKLDAAKKFVDWIASADGCAVQKKVSSIAGPFPIKTCSLPSDVPQIAKDIQAYYDKDLTVPALEFLSPIKGPNLENITVEVGSGIRGPVDGAKLYDKDVEKQAQQLGLPGW